MYETLLNNIDGSEHDRRISIDRYHKENTLKSRSTLTLESVADERQYWKAIYQEKSERQSANQPSGMEF